MEPPPVAHVLDLLRAQQGQLAALASRLSRVQDEHEALCGCLAASGEVPADRLLAMMHRKRFEAAVRRHPCTSHESLETIAQSRELVLTVAANLGLAGNRDLRATSRAVRRGMTAVGPELAALFPPVLFAVGGEAGGAALSLVERFDVRANAWSQSVPLEQPRSGCAAVSLGGQIYVVGGCNAEGEDLNTVERLDERRGVWESQPPMQAGRDELAAVATEGRLYALGGSHLMWPVRHVIDTVECLTPSSGVWEQLPILSRERCAAAAVTLRGRVFVLGGCDEDGTALDSVERYDIDARAWQPLPPMRQPRCNFAAVAAGDRIFVAGGYDARMRDLAAVECLDLPGSEAWELVASLALPRWGVRAVSVAGAIFVVGGHACDGEVGSVDRLEPPASQGAALSPLRQARRSFGLAFFREGAW